MANPFGITEVALNQLGDATNAINTTARSSVYQPAYLIVFLGVIDFVRP